jgi:ribosomal protein S18 acetylase RimI-like enzyme
MLELAGPMILRPFALADARPIERWLVGPGLSVPAGEASRQWPHRLLEDSRIVSRIAEIGGLRVGFLRLDCGPDHIAELTLVVAPECRRLGHGSEILEAALNCARQRGVRRLDANVDLGNQPALLFFLEHGFERGPLVGDRVRLSRLVHASEHQKPLDI